MAYLSVKETVLCEFMKTDKKKIVIKKIVDAKLQTSYDIREMYFDEEADEFRYSKSGVRFSSENIVDLVSSLISAMTKEELIDLDSQVGSKFFDKLEDTDEIPEDPDDDPNAQWSEDENGLTQQDDY